MEFNISPVLHARKTKETASHGQRPKHGRSLRKSWCHTANKQFLSVPERRQAHKLGISVLFRRQNKPPVKRRRVFNSPPSNDHSNGTKQLQSSKCESRAGRGDDTYGKVRCFLQLYGSSFKISLSGQQLSDNVSKTVPEDADFLDRILIRHRKYVAFLVPFAIMQVSL